MSNRACPVCDSPQIRMVLEIPEVPVVCNLTCATREQALAAPRADLRLAGCGACGHLFNVAFDPSLVEYSPHYFNSLHGSPQFQSYAEGLAGELAQRHALRGRRVVEIGCGRGEFLKLLCGLAGAQGLGFDPGCEGTAEGGAVRLVARRFTESDAAIDAALFCCRQTLEHLPDPAEFLAMLRRGIGRRPTPVFCEVPNALFLVRQGAVWDFIYEHYSYFSPHSLGHLFARSGFQVRRLREVYGRQYLALEATADGDGAGWTEAPTAPELTRLPGRYRAKIEGWRETLRHLQRAGRRAVVWGAGSKGVMFLNTLRERCPVDYVVDLHPHKQGNYVAGAGQKIVPPEFLRSYQPHLIVVMNPIYREEIRSLAGDLGLGAEVRCA